jgi:hypothetical protein
MTNDEKMKLMTNDEDTRAGAAWVGLIEVQAGPASAHAAINRGDSNLRPAAKIAALQQTQKETSK